METLASSSFSALIGPITVDHLGPAEVGETLTVGASVEHTTRSMVFASCRVTVGARPVARASVVFSGRATTAG